MASVSCSCLNIARREKELVPAAEIVVQPLAESEVEHLIHAPWPGGKPERHQDRFARQQRDEVLYLIGWQDDEPVGQLLLVWAGPEYEPLTSTILDCAEIQDFVVRPDLRSRGIGHQMLALAEDLTRARGLRRLGLYVGLDNPRARALYHRLGFTDANCGIVIVRWQYPGPDGHKHWAEQRCTYLVKDLATTDPGG
jgi:GNAT superfamily N-acetyltransferase